mgnify:CR=1 FL=1
MLYVDNVDEQHINILQQMQHIINLYVEQMSVLYSFSTDEINTLKTTFVNDFSKQKETVGTIENPIPDGVCEFFSRLLSIIRIQSTIS